MDVEGEHPRLNYLSRVCREYEVHCILAGFVVLGAAIAAIKASD